MFGDPMAEPVRQLGPRVKTMSTKGKAWLVQLEGGVRLTAYRDSAGIPTIGVGMTYWPTTRRRRVEMGDVIDNTAQGMALFASALRDYESTVDAATHDRTTQQQFDAFVSLAYNIGEPAFRRSTAVRLHNAGAPTDEIAEAIERWRYEGDRVSPGLVERRACEVDAYRHGIYRVQGQRAA